MIGILVDENNDLQVSVKKDSKGLITQGLVPVSYTHLTLPTNREV